MSLTKTDITNQEILTLAKEVFDIEAQSIIELSNRLGQDFTKAIETLYNCKGRVIVTGMGKSGLIGKKIVATFSSTGTPSFFLHPAESSHGDSGALTKGDVVLAISNSGETAELLQLLPLIQRFDLKLIGMTGKSNSTLAQKSDVFLDIAVEKEACPNNLAPTASTTVTLAMGDALAVCLLKKRGFTPEDFLIFHPGGALGKGILWKVEDLMKTGDDIPKVNINSSFQDVIHQISIKKLGMTVVVNDNNETKGIITDGDIRRLLLNNSNINELKIVDVIRGMPKNLEKTALAAKALQIMEKYSITSLLINDKDGKVEGIVHIHDLLKAGVV